ncbi:hypothetical protein BGX23_002180 [Mortierella sp. AD031]|nr:hypothetical protein BGX23_002180 [Mortierella sp. AD031]
MVAQDNELQERLQGLCPVFKSGPPTSSTSQLEIVHVDIQLDPTGKEIVLWADILVAFKGAVNIQHKSRIVPFLKDTHFNTADSAAAAVVVAAVATTTPPPSTTQSVLPQSGVQEPTRSKRNPEYDPMEMANTLLKEFDIPTALPRGPQPTSDNPVGGYTLPNHSIIIPPSISTSTNTSRLLRALEVSIKGSAKKGTTLSKEMIETIAKAKENDITAQVKLGDALRPAMVGFLGITSQPWNDFSRQPAEAIPPPSSE